MKNKLDFVGMALSIGCMIHCLLLPLVIPILPMLGFAFDHDSYSHLILATIITVIAAVALIPGLYKHQSPYPMFLAANGIILIITMGIVETTIEHPIITIITVIGSIYIAIAHYLNHKYLCSCSCEHHNHDT